MWRKKLITLILFLCTLASFAISDGSELEWKNVNFRGRNKVVYSIYSDSRGIVWIGTNNGLFVYDGFNTYPADSSGEFNSQVYSVVEYGGRLYIGTNNGLFYRPTDEGVITRVDGAFPSEIRGMLLNGDELIIGGLFGVQIYNLKDGSLRDVSAGLPHKSVYALVRDRRGVVYAGTYDGLARWNIGKDRFENVEIIRPANGRNLFVNAIAEMPDGTMWLGTGGALIHFDPVNEKAVEDSRFKDLNIKSLAVSGKGTLLVGTETGLYARTDSTAMLYRHDSRDGRTIGDNEIWTVLADVAGNILAGTARGFSVSSYSDAVHTTRLDNIIDSGDSNEIYSACRDSHGDMWLGGTDGLLRIAADGRATRYAPDNGGTLSHKRVRAITEDSKGVLWVATDAGLNRYDRAADRFVQYRVADKSGRYKANWVYAVADVGDRLITGSFLGGLHFVDREKFRESDKIVVADSVINSSDGIANDFVSNLIVDGSGNIWVLLFRENGIMRIDARSGAISRVDFKEITGQYPSLICTDSRGRVWSAGEGSVLLLDTDGTVLGKTRLNLTHTDDGVVAINSVGDGDVWLSTTGNVWRISGDDMSAQLMPLPAKCFTLIYEDPETKNVLLGDDRELLTVNPRALHVSGRNDSIRLVRNDGRDYFLADAPVKFRVPYSQPFEVNISTLDYSPESAQHFAYKILRSDADTVGGWIYMPEGSNVLQLSGISMGSHRVAVRVAAPGTPVSVFTVDVLPPWYLSWWAITLYVLSVIAAIAFLVVSLRRRASKRIEHADRLRAIAEAERRLAFLSDISHDLKTPLSLIVGPVSRLRERITDPSERRALDTVYDNALKLNNMIHRTIELDTFDEDTDNMLIMSRFDAVDFCRSIFDSYRESHSDKNFSFHAPDAPVVVEADAVKMESIVNNLLSNACKYSGENATVSLSLSVKEGNLEMIVSDDGMGIPDAEHSLVFQRMYRSARTASLREGTGIGLYLIKKYLGLLGGTIELYSRENEGTTFIITLPLAPGAQGAPALAVPAGDSTRPKVLVVEDNMAVADFICETLAGTYRCATAGNGRSGLAMVSSFAPDLIIVDEMMPVMTGMEMVRRLKENPRTATIPVIMLTAKTDNATETQSVRMGIDVFMAKPFEPQLLLARAGQLLEARSSMRRAMRMEELSAPAPVEVESAAEKQLAQISRIIEENMADPDLNVAALAEKTGIGTKQLYRLLKKYIGDTPVDYIRRMRLRKAAMLLEQQKLTVSEIMYMVGFKTSSYFSKCFQAEYGCTPSEYARRSSGGAN